MAAEGHAYLLGATLGDVETPLGHHGWPEFTVTLRYYVLSDDPEVIDRRRREVFEQDWRPSTVA